MLNQIIKNWINKKLKTFEDGSLRLSIPGCSDIIIGDHNQPQFDITFTSIRGIYLILRRGVLGFTEGFIKGYWITDNLQKTMTFLAKNLSNVESIKKGNSRKFITKFQHWLRENTLSRSKKNIHASNTIKSKAVHFNKGMLRFVSRITSDTSDFVELARKIRLHLKLANGQHTV